MLLSAWLKLFQRRVVLGGRMQISRLTTLVAGVALIAAVASGSGLASSRTLEATEATSPAADVSSNWAGYVATGNDALSVVATSFSSVSGTWVAPKADCTTTASTGSSGSAASAFWVGLGGNATTSNALEQAGTEADCTATGAHYFAWYELVPKASVQIKLAVDPGNSISSTVTVTGTKVTVLLRNLTLGTSYTKTLTMADPDTSSAEWIAEAPSVCSSASFCREQALTDFGTVKFSHATAISGGHSGTISDADWTDGPVELQASGGGGFGGFGHEESAADATASSLATGGSAFSVTWHALPAQSTGGYGGGGYGGGGYGGYGGGGGGGYL
jgi:hypothetical protein